MALSGPEGNVSNTPELLHSLVGETIVGTIVDYDGNRFLVVKSGHAIVFSANGAFWRDSPEVVRRLIERRKSDLGRWSSELSDLARIVTETEAK